MLWGLEVKPGRATPYVPPPEGGVTHVVRATLDESALDGERNILRVQVSDGSPIVVASMRGGSTETVSLDLVLDEYAEFTVSGNSSVHLIGNLEADQTEDEDEEDEEYEPSAEELELLVQRGLLGSNMESEDSEEDEETTEEEEEEDGIGFYLENRKSNILIEELDEDTPSEPNRKDKQSKQGAEESKKTVPSDAKRPVDNRNASALPAENRPTTSKGTKASEKRKAAPQDSEGKIKKQAKSEKNEKQAVAKASKQEMDEEVKAGLLKGGKNVRRYENGFEIMELQMGKPDGRLAQPGKKVEMRYVGKLKSNGKIFDQTRGKSTFKFRLGVGEVIKGWDVGVQGMRVGDKRRLTIPPQMAYGSGGVKGTIPPNSTLVFDVELVHVS